MRLASRRAVAAILTASLVASPVLCLPATAIAETRGTDIVLGKKADDRQLQANMLPDVTAPHAILVSADGSSLYERDADAEVKIASTTKLMTAYVALKYGKMDQEVSVSADAAKTVGSNAQLKDGDKMTLKDALTGLMLPSGNDAAVAIADSVGKTIDANSQNPYQTFIDKMNEEAKALGMNNTLYKNPNGLDVDQWAGDQHSTARDLAKLVVEAMKSDDLKAIVSQADATITVTQKDGTTRDIQLKNTDKLLGAYNGATGVKTGHTDLAGYCFIGSVTKNNATYYSVVLGADSQDNSFKDTRVLWDWASVHTITYRLTDGMKTKDVKLDGQDVTVPIAAHVAHHDYPDKTFDATISDWDKPLSTYDVAGGTQQRVEYSNVTGDVHVGDKVGKLEFIQDGAVIDSRDLIAIEDVSAPSDLQKVIIGISRLIRQFQGKDTVASSSMEPFDNTADGNGNGEGNSNGNTGDGSAANADDGNGGNASADGTATDTGITTSNQTNRDVSTNITIDNTNGQ